MRKWMLSCVCAVALAAAVPSVAMAQDQDEPIDARLAGFSETVHSPSGGTAGAYFLWSFLAVVAAGTVFIDAKRTHLD